MKQSAIPVTDWILKQAEVIGSSLKEQQENPSGISPTEYKVLVKPKPVEAKIGSIIIPDSKKDSDKFATVEGHIVAASPLAFSYATADEWVAAGAAKPKPGDTILYAKYAGVWMKGKDGQEYLIINDKDIVATIEE